MKTNKLLLLLLGTVAMSSCLKDKYSTENIKVDYSPKVAIPLINAEVITEDLLSEIDTSLIAAGPDDVLRIVFSDTIQSIALDEFVEIPRVTEENSFTLSDIAFDDISENESVKFEQIVDPLLADLNGGTLADQAIAQAINNALENGTQAPFPELPVIDPIDFAVDDFGDFTEVTFSEGNMTITITNNFAIPISDVLIKLSSNNVAIGEFDFDGVIQPGNSQAEVLSLADQKLSKTLNMSIELGSPGAPAPGVVMSKEDLLDFKIDITGAKIKSGIAPIKSQEFESEEIELFLALNPKEDSEQTEQTDTMKIEEISFSALVMKLDLDYGIKEDAEIVIEIPKATKGGASFSKTISIDSDHTNPTPKSETLDLGGYTIELEDNKISVKVTASILQSNDGPGGTVTQVPFSSEDEVKYTFDLEAQNAVFENVKGNFGSQEVSFNENVSTGLGDDELLSSIKLVAPIVTISFDNSFGIALDVSNLDLEATGGTEDVTLTGLGGFTVKRGTDAGGLVTSELVIEAPATNIDDLVNSQADTFKVNGVAKIIPPIGSQWHSASSSSELVARLNVEVPMHGTIKGLEVLDTLDVELGEIVENAESIVLRAVITNDFPLDGNIQMLFLNDDDTVLDSLIAKGGDGTFMKAAKTDANGITTADGASVKTTDFTLNKATLSKLGSATKIILRVTISSGNNGTDVMKILSTYNMNVKLGVIAKVQVGDLIGSDD